MKFGGHAIVGLYVSDSDTLVLRVIREIKFYQRSPSSCRSRSCNVARPQQFWRMTKQVRPRSLPSANAFADWILERLMRKTTI
jgi:hypothetical protein